MEATPIAVIGLSYRAPGIGGKGLWEFLEQAKSAWSEFPRNRYDHKAFWKPGDHDKSGTYRAEGAHFLPDDVHAFDAAFFHMRAEEARASDPQHRLMLECALEAAEDAGKSLLDLAGTKTAVFVGAGQHEYSQRLGEDHHAANTFSATGIGPCMVANRISYFFDIDGPSVAVDAACASSVYAAHQAVSALSNGECSAAFVGAAALSLTPGGWLTLDKMGALSTHGRSYSYDEKAAGFGRGEGAACLLIKRVDDALRDGDPIRAVIRSSACNHGGRAEGITMPNGAAHRKLLRMVHDKAGLDPRQTPVVEGHGTGTAAGDPIEAGAFAAVLAEDRTSSNPLHLEGASGVLAIVKAVLMIEKGVVLPTAGFEKMNPKIPGQDRLKVTSSPIPWPENELKRVLVTNFGFGGSNSAIILEDAAPWTSRGRISNGTAGTNGTNGTKDDVHGTDGAVSATNGVNGSGANGIHYINGTNGHHTNGTGGHHINGTNGHGSNRADQSGRPQLFVLSARSEKSLASYCASFGEYLDDTPESRDFMRNLSYTLGQRRSHFPHRVSVVADSVAALQDKLSTSKPSRAKDQNLAFAFTGQGAQYAQMASGLGQYKVFREAMDTAEAQLRALGAPWSLTEELSKSEADSLVNDAEISQPACTAVQIALVMLLQSWGVKPTMVTGHSSGEIAAAFAAGLIAFEAAIAVAYFRGQAAAILAGSRSRRGAMLAVGVGSHEAEKLVQDHADGHYATVAAINSPSSVTISGDQPAIDAIHKAAERGGLFARKLKVQVAYHSRHMEEVADYYLRAIKPFVALKGHSPPSAHGDEGDSRPVFISAVTGRALEPGVDNLDASYWVRNLVQPVRFADAIQTMFSPKSGKSSTGGAARDSVPSILLEVGPHAALKNPIKQTVESVQTSRGQPAASSFTYLASLLRGSNAMDSLMNLAGSLFNIGGVPIQLGQVNQTDMHNAHVVTGLPAYAWDKSVSYEVRPRATHEALFPGEPFHPLLGRKMAATGGNQRIYRQVFTLDEMPWIRDHVVAGAVIFPMTGYMSCAIEAARRTLAAPAASLLIQDFHVVARLEMEEEQTVELVTRLWPMAIGTDAFSSTIWSFAISSWSETTGWSVHAYGRIEPEMEDMTTATPTLQAGLRDVDTTASLIEHDIVRSYEEAGVRATRYGPTFRNSVRFFEGHGYTVLEHRLRDLGAAQWQPGPYGSHVTVDPPTIDGFLQGGAPLQKTEDGKRPAQMPNYISRFRISNNIPANPKQRFDIVTRLLEYDVKGGRMQVSVAVFARQGDGRSLAPIAEWESLAFRTIGSADEDDGDAAAEIPDNWVWELLPRIDLMPADEVSSRFAPGQLDQAQVAGIRDLETAASYYIHRVCKVMAEGGRPELPFHLSRFVNWAARYVSRHKIEFDAEPTALLEKVRRQDGQGEMLCAVGERLMPILRGEVEALEIMLTDGRLTRHYEADLGNKLLSSVLGDVMLDYSNLEPNLRILEIGAGTAGTTLPVLEALSRTIKQGAFLNYTFTDISSGFFENARNKLARWSPRITYKKLDISQDPLAQGFDADEFDVVIAANVLHATKNMAATMDNLRLLLKPKGKLVVLEANHHSVVLVPFMLLPGWWYAEDDYRDLEEGPMMPTEVWNRLLLDTGFSGVDACVQVGSGSKGETMSVMCSKKVARQDNPGPITVCGPLIDDDEVAFAQAVADAISERLGLPVETKPLAEIDSSSDSYYIVLDAPQNTLLRDVSPDKFESLQSLLLHNQGLLWVIPEGGVPETSFIKGMLRSLRIEEGEKSLLLFDQVPHTSRGVSGIVKLVDVLLDPEATRAEDQDFVWHNGSVHLPRMRMLKDYKERFAAEQGVSFRKEQNMWEGDGALEMTTDVSGSPDSIYFRRTQNLLQQQLGEDDIIVEVEAVGVSHRDLDLVLGAIPWAPPGFDGAGKVIKVGSGVAHLQDGDRVFFLSLDGSAFSTYKRMPAWHAARVPAHLSIPDAASIPLAYSLAVLALMRTARLRENETVLVHSAAGAVGQACVAIAQHLGARVLATAGTSEKREFLHRAFGIPANHIFSSRTPHFRDEILCATEGRGADVIVNSLGGERLADTWALAARFGRFVEIDKKAAFQNNHLPMKTFDKNVSFSSIDLRGLYQHKPEEVKEVFGEVVRLLGRRVITPIKPLTVLPVSQFASSLRKLRSGDGMGKIVLTLGKDEHVMAESALRPAPFSLRPDATYLITGGTRGIGNNLAYWMIENGARYVVLLGRSGASGSEVQRMLEKFQGTDVTVRALACDIGSREDLAKVVESIQDLPPVRGVVHSALLLSDKLLENATYEDWEINTGPRVQGAWNLHELMPDNLDFFIALGSFNGESGNGGQAIYAGTAAFYDAFAQYRNARGQHTVSICLPVVLDVGYVADRSLGSALKQSLGATLTMANIRTIVKGIIGRSPVFYHNGRSIFFKLYLDGKRIRDGPWEYLHPVHAMARLKADKLKDKSGRGGGADVYSTSWTAAENPLEGLTEALITKVAAMAILEREEVQADAPVASYNLDSLVSVELRNWVRRETGVELQLSAIIQAASLRALAADILEQRAGNSAA
ncbi:uncharacterized protein UV8b_01706 [Ustilaginoidea virens]|uniref:Polyketide synthase n=1 Tax=Ustilaginoidea virens TaxID=1159556 RepID=A0A8E5HL38_USTVR|nr:uncharacterized protein UV8b_01706 [Ustilaginoidea virens]QUC17465.1 hypothetical protein UV8b_01706 [Ustilaginoidea virens]